MSFDIHDQHLNVTLWLIEVQRINDFKLKLFIDGSACLCTLYEVAHEKIHYWILDQSSHFICWYDYILRPGICYQLQKVISLYNTYYEFPYIHNHLP